MKIALIGCSTETLFLAKSLAQNAKKLNIEKISFYDRIPAVRDVFCSFCVSLCRSLDSQLRCIAESNVVEALIGADYIITDLNGFTDSRPQESSAVIRKQGVLSHPFFGASAFAAALRHVPVFLQICGQARRYAKPNMQILNLTSPGGVILQAAWESGYDFVYGFPVAGMKAANALTKLMKKDPKTVSYSFFGSAEASVITDVRVDGKSILSELLNEDALYQQTVFSGFSKKMLMQLKCLPSPLWSVCFYPDQYLKLQSQKETAAEAEIYTAQMRCLSTLAALDFDKQRFLVLSAIDKMLNAQSAAVEGYYPDLDSLDSLNPYHAETTSSALAVIDFLQARISNEKRPVHLLLKNDNRMPVFTADYIVSVNAFVSVDEISAPRADAADTIIMEQIRRELYFEKSLAHALVSENVFGLTASLATHPLVNSYSVAAALVGVLQQINNK